MLTHEAQTGMVSTEHICCCSSHVGFFPSTSGFCRISNSRRTQDTLPQLYAASHRWTQTCALRLAAFPLRQSHRLRHGCVPAGSLPAWGPGASHLCPCEPKLQPSQPSQPPLQQADPNIIKAKLYIYYSIYCGVLTIFRILPLFSLWSLFFWNCCQSCPEFQFGATILSHKFYFFSLQFCNLWDFSEMRIPGYSTTIYPHTSNFHKGGRWGIAWAESSPSVPEGLGSCPSCTKHKSPKK